MKATTYTVKARTPLAFDIILHDKVTVFIAALHHFTHADK